MHLADKREKISIYRIVGPDEFDHKENYISVDSPLAQVLLRREVGENVTVEVPGGIHRYLITNISY